MRWEAMFGDDDCFDCCIMMLDCCRGFIARRYAKMTRRASGLGYMAALVGYAIVFISLCPGVRDYHLGLRES